MEKNKLCLKHLRRGKGPGEIERRSRRELAEAGVLEWPQIRISLGRWGKEILFDESNFLQSGISAISEGQSGIFEGRFGGRGRRPAAVLWGEKPP